MLGYDNGAREVRCWSTRGICQDLGIPGLASQSGIIEGHICFGSSGLGVGDKDVVQGLA